LCTHKAWCLGGLFIAKGLITLEKVRDFMRFLFVHQNFPAQFGRMATQLAANPENQVVFLTGREDVQLPNVQKAIFKETRKVGKETHHYIRHIEGAVLQGQAAFRAGLDLKKQGFVPDVIYGHSGFGASLYLKDLYPGIPLMGYFEWLYHAHGTDADFDPGEVLTLDDECRIRTKNMVILQELYACDAGVSPTYWQHSQFPVEYRNKLRIIHDGIDTRRFRPDTNAKLVLPNIKLDLSEAEEIVTYVGRGMEPYRGFPQFMEAVSLLLKKRPKCHVVIVGAERIAYGSPHPSGKSYKELMLEKYPYDMERLHFTGPLPYGDYRKVLQASTVHVYLTRPFVLSWSALEAMSCGCTLVASDTAPMREVVRDRENGLLVDFFAPQKLAERIEEALDDKALRATLGANARETVKANYDIERLLPLHIQLVVNTAQKR
jgi:glycosyltransferase involved in cell wall biosynthesis